MPPTLDFSPLEPKSTPLFCSLTAEQEASLAAFPKCKERIVGTLQLTYLLQMEEPGSVHAGTYFRSAIAEFASLDDVAECELGSGRKVLLEATFPLPHILKQLRHLALHIKAVPLQSVPIELELCGLRPSGPVEIHRWFVMNLSVGDLLLLNAFSSKKPIYTKNQALEMVKWFSDAQSFFGVGDLIHRAVDDVVRRVGKI